MKFYLFTQDTAYGEFFEIVCANNAEEAWDISKAKQKNWDNSPQEIIMAEKPSTIASGGGSIG